MKKGDVGKLKHFSKKYGNKGRAFNYLQLFLVGFSGIQQLHLIFYSDFLVSYLKMWDKY